jgi:hypothetical protein
MQYCRMESKMVRHAADGTRVNTDIYRLTLKCVPALAGTDGDRWTCLRFAIQLGSAPEVAIPSLLRTSRMRTARPYRRQTRIMSHP